MESRECYRLYCGIRRNSTSSLMACDFCTCSSRITLEQHLHLHPSEASEVSHHADRMGLYIDDQDKTKGVVDLVEENVKKESQTERWISPEEKALDAIRSVISNYIESDNESPLWVLGRIEGILDCWESLRRR